MIAALITARGGSKGLPGKHMLELGAKPLIAHTFEVASACSAFDKVILSTDIPEVISLAKNHYPRIEIPFVRPEHLCRDDSAHSDVVMHAIDFMEQDGCVPDSWVLLQPTSPFRELSELEVGCGFLKNGAETVLGVSKVMHHPAEYVYQNPSGKIGFIMAEYAGRRRQEYPDIYFDNGAFYGFTTGFFKKNLKFFDEESKLLLMSEKSLIDIDTPFDMALAKGINDFYI